MIIKGLKFVFGNPDNFSALFHALGKQGFQIEIGNRSFTRVRKGDTEYIIQETETHWKLIPMGIGDRWDFSRPIDIPKS